MKIRIERPLIFLCGPYLGEKETDRRHILYREISNYTNENKNYSPMPFIVDLLFNDETSKERKLNISLLEEIVASISLQTYIFLDTLSTSMELGLFAKYADSNSIKVLIPIGDDNVGSFVKQSITANSDFIEIWNYDSDNRKTEENKIYRYFTDDKMPQNLEEKIKSNLDNLSPLSNLKEVEFELSKINTKKYNVINYYIDKEDKIIFNIDTKLLFYMILSDDCTTNIRAQEINDELVSKLIINLKTTLFKELLHIETKYKHTLANMSFEERIDKVYIRNILSDDLEQLIRHILNIVQVIEKDNKANNAKTQSLVLSRNRAVSSTTYAPNIYSYNDLFNLNKDDFYIIDSYKKNPNKYIKTFVCSIRNKKKTIHTYANNKYGESLKKLHEKINKTFNKFPTSNISFAYKKGRSIKDAVIIHLNSSDFIKKDISRFFESIKRSHLMYKVLSILDKKPKDKNKYNIDNENYVKKIQFQYGCFFSKTKDSNLRKILSVCFYKNKLPIGFVTSPTLSNIYMYDTDIKIEELIKETNIVVSRYADDLLISTNDPNGRQILSELESKINKLLEEIYLTENISKRLYRTFKNEGDFIKFLGINIVKGKDKNKLTVSNHYIIKTIEMELYQNAKKEKIRGRQEFIKSVSEESYKKFLYSRKIRNMNKN